jgi:hypothetical protein
MIVEQVKRDIQRSDSFQERSMGLAVGSEAFVFNVLRKDLYSDPIGSLIREYTVNAQDEHRKHGKSDSPIYIKVPNAFSPELHIRDYAGGLTEEQVFEFFGNYGASDKRDSNLAVGFFGLGCKSAFAYTDSYIVKSFKDGKVYTFNIYIDETEIGRVAKISEEKTDEGNGVLVIVPVRTKDVSEFQTKVISTVAYFKTRPTLDGFSEQPVFDESEPVIAGDGWKFYKNNRDRYSDDREPRVIMGEIAYPISVNDFGYDLEQWERSLLQSKLHFYIGIGEVQVTASREALQMTPKTISAIREKLKAVKAEMLKQTQKAFEDAKTLIEAKSLYYSVIYSGGGYGNIIRNSNDKIKWNGEELTDYFIKFPSQSGHWVTVYHRSYRGTIKSSTEHTLNCDDKEIIYFDDTNKTKVNYRRRARTLLQNGVDTIRVLHSDNIPELEKLLRCSVKTLQSYDAIVPTNAPSTGRVGTGIDKDKRKKHTAKLFQLNLKELSNYSGGVASDYWEAKEVDDTKEIVYIPLNRFHPNLPNISKLGTLQDVILNLKSVGIEIDIPVYGTKEGQDVTGFTRLDKWIEKKLESAIDLKKEYSLIQAIDDYTLIDVGQLDEKKLSDGLAKEYTILYKEAKKIYNKSNRRTISRLFSSIKADIKPEKKLKELSKQFGENYPLLKYINNYYFGKSEVIAYLEGQQGKGV